MADITVGNNPFFAAFGSALGFNNLFDGKDPGGAPPAPVQMKPPAVPVNETEKIRESKAVRQTYPKAPTRGLGLGGNSGPGMGMNLPGVMSPEVLMHPDVQNLLGQYGVSPEQLQQTVQGANPNLFVTNPAAFQHHPLLANMLERGMEGLAFTHGGANAGETISNVAQGVLNAQAARSDKYNNQLMMPFAQAGQVATLKNEDAKRKLEESQASYDQSHANYWDMMGDLRPQMEQDKKTNQSEQNKLKARIANMKMTMDPRFSHLSDEDSKAMQDEIKQAGGLGNLDDSRLEYFGRLGQMNIDSDKRTAEAKKEAGRNTRASILANVRQTTSPTSYEVPKMRLAEAEKVEKSVEEEQKQFLQNIQSGFAEGPEGTVYAGDEAAIGRARSLYKQRWDAAHAETKRITDALTAPGAGMTNTPAPAAATPRKSKGKTYNPNTGRIE